VGTIRHEVGINADPKSVFEAITDKHRSPRQGGQGLARYTLADTSRSGNARRRDDRWARHAETGNGG
jgi:uncharacterized protein YndB with AHSA1/START domain